MTATLQSANLLLLRAVILPPWARVATTMRSGAQSAPDDRVEEIVERSERRSSGNVRSRVMDSTGRPDVLFRYEGGCDRSAPRQFGVHG